jgi:hypothetical protein
LKPLALISGRFAHERFKASLYIGSVFITAADWSTKRNVLSAGDELVSNENRYTPLRDLISFVL